MNNWYLTLNWNVMCSKGCSGLYAYNWSGIYVGGADIYPWGFHEDEQYIDWELSIGSAIDPW